MFMYFALLSGLYPELVLSHVGFITVWKYYAKTMTFCYDANIGPLRFEKNYI